MFVCAIDNEPRILDGMRTMLEGWGCRVVVAGSRAEAVAEIEAAGAAPGAIIADYHLDDDDGLSVVNALRERFGVETPAVLVTADRSDDVRDRAAAAEIRILPKPLRPAALRSLLAQWRVTRSAAE